MHALFLSLCSKHCVCSYQQYRLINDIQCSHKTGIHSRVIAANFWSDQTEADVVTKCEQTLRKRSLTVQLAVNFAHKYVKYFDQRIFFCIPATVLTYGQSLKCQSEKVVSVVIRSDKTGNFFLFAKRKEKKHKTYIPGSFHVGLVRLGKHCMSSACHQETFIIWRNIYIFFKKKSPELDVKSQNIRESN